MPSDRICKVEQIRFEFFLLINENKNEKIWQFSIISLSEERYWAQRPGNIFPMVNLNVLLVHSTHWCSKVTKHLLSRSLCQQLSNISVHKKHLEDLLLLVVVVRLHLLKVQVSMIHPKVSVLEYGEVYESALGQLTQGQVPVEAGTMLCLVSGGAHRNKKCPQSQST